MASILEPVRVDHDDARIHHGGDIVIPDDNRRGGSDNASVTYRKH